MEQLCKVGHVKKSWIIRTRMWTNDCVRSSSVIEQLKQRILGYLFIVHVPGCAIGFLLPHNLLFIWFFILNSHVFVEVHMFFLWLLLIFYSVIFIWTSNSCIKMLNVIEFKFTKILLCIVLKKNHPNHSRSFCLSALSKVTHYSHIFYFSKHF